MSKNSEQTAPKSLYLDHNATTPMRREVAEAYGAWLAEKLCNPSSIHGSGRRARQVLDEARDRAATALGVTADEIVFTSGGTEANNLALLGALEVGIVASSASMEYGALVTTAVEHSSVLGPAQRLRSRGHVVHTLPVDSAGLPHKPQPDSWPPSCRLVSVMAANNEVGSCPDITSFVAAARDFSVTFGVRRPLVHTDLVQAIGKVPVKLDALGVDLASISLHKVGGPRGVGILVRRAGAVLEPPFTGGEQELGIRPGTEDVASIAAGVLALELALDEQSEYNERVGALCRSFWAQLQAEISTIALLGPPIEDERRLPNTLNVLLPGDASRVLVTRLDLMGLEVSAGSACSSGSLEPSHVLRAMGHDDQHARAGLRLSLGRETSKKDVEKAVEILGTSHRECVASRSRAGA